MTTDAGSGFDDQAASRDAAANPDEIEEESRHLAGEEARDALGDPAVEDPDEARERQHVHDEVNEAF
ncbi:MAG TPA: hypothetical protein VJ966_06140 [Actinomycetes bacterium]|nr:hypothetical protein [Actinomycetes bacterium]